MLTFQEKEWYCHARVHSLGRVVIGCHPQEVIKILTMSWQSPPNVTYPLRYFSFKLISTLDLDSCLFLLAQSFATFPLKGHYSFEIQEDINWNKLTINILFTMLGNPESAWYLDLHTRICKHL